MNKSFSSEFRFGSVNPSTPAAIVYMYGYTVYKYKVTIHGTIILDNFIQSLT